MLSFLAQLLPSSLFHHFFSTACALTRSHTHTQQSAWLCHDDWLCQSVCECMIRTRRSSSSSRQESNADAAVLHSLLLILLTTSAAGFILLSTLRSLSHHESCAWGVYVRGKKEASEMRGEMQSVFCRHIRSYHSGT